MVEAHRAGPLTLDRRQYAPRRGSAPPQDPASAREPNLSNKTQTCPTARQTGPPGEIANSASRATRPIASLRIERLGLLVFVRHSQTQVDRSQQEEHIRLNDVHAEVQSDEQHRDADGDQ